MSWQAAIAFTLRVCHTVHMAGNRGENITVFDAAEPSSAVELLTAEGINEKV